MGLFFYTKKGSIISTVDLPTTEIIEPKKEGYMETYETFAKVNDAIMDDSLYDKWTAFSLRHLPKKKQAKLLELACGTGIQSLRFKEAGFSRLFLS